MKWQRELDIAKQAALKAGEYLREADRKAVLSSKGRDIKHRSDIASENMIIKDIRKNNDYVILTEESGLHGDDIGAAPFWVIDPLDGTLNYSKDIDLCCVSIALWQKASPLVGVVYDFNRDQLFSGVPGEGAWLKDTPIHCSNIHERKNAVLATGFPVNRDFSSQSLQGFISDIQAFKKIRLLGSAALSMAYVACGRIDAYSEEDIMFWDVAAGIALVKAAGGYVRHEDSKSDNRRKSVYAGHAFNPAPKESVL